MRRCQALLGAALAAGLAACGDANPGTDGDNPMKQFTSAINEMQKAAEGFTKGDRKPVPPVAFRDLMGFLPTRLDGMKAEEPKGETTTAGAWQYSQAEVAFHSPDRKRSAEVGVFDYAHIPFLYVPFRMLLGMKFARESTEGYERSGQIEGFPAYEKWGKNQDSEAVVMVGDRFIVKAETNGVGEGSARRIIERMNLKGLAAKGS